MHHKKVINKNVTEIALFFVILALFANFEAERAKNGSKIKKHS
jgi:hypothetical protein